MKLKQQLKELIDKAYGDKKSDHERTQMVDSLMEAVPRTGTTKTFCKVIDGTIYKVGIITRFSDTRVSKTYFTVNEAYEDIDW